MRMPQDSIKVDFKVKSEEAIDKAVKLFTQGVSKGLDETAIFILARSHDFIEEKDIYDTGALTIHSGVDLAKPLTKYVYYEEVYAPFQEFGTGPSAEDPQDMYWPKFQPILDWVIRKHIIFTDHKTGKPMTAEQTARLIVFHIHAHGLAPRPYFRPAINEGEAKKEEYCKKAIDKLMKEAKLLAGKPAK